jgi:FKBP-type peptidyl-prolyl cis-trans isomerase FkpA
MKRLNFFFVVVIAIACGVSCGKIDYRKTSTGLLYKLFPGNGKDSLMKPGQAVKFNIITKLNDSTLYDSHDKMPGFAEVVDPKEPRAQYSFIEVLPLMRTGDSIVVVQLVDSLMKKDAQGLPPGAKKGDKINWYIKIIQVFPDVNTAKVDFEKEMERDRPRQMKEQEEARKKMEEEKKKEVDRQYAELEKSGEIAKEFKAMDAYLASKNIVAQKTGRGTYVVVKEKGAEPLATAGKYVQVKYTGKILETDSTFESSVYNFQLGIGQVIMGWDEGLMLFGKGGKGTLYIPGFLAYGQAGGAFKPFQAMKFDVEMQEISDTPIQQQPRTPPPPPEPKKGGGN